jgi:hypothetical protein
MTRSRILIPLYHSGTHMSICNNRAGRKNNLHQMASCGSGLINNQATNVIFNNKTLINFGISVMEHRISCHRKYRFVAVNAARSNTNQMTTRKINCTLRKSKICNRLSNLLTVLLILLSFESCEGNRCAEGTVFDKTTNLPLDGVLVEVITTESKAAYTDTSGKFDVCNKMGGCVPNCKDIMIRFSKNNYQTITLTNPEKDANVMMER